MISGYVSFNRGLNYLNETRNSSGDETMAVWDILSGECERVFSVNGSVVCLQVVGNSVVAGFGDNSIQIWEWYETLALASALS